MNKKTIILTALLLSSGAAMKAQTASGLMTAWQEPDVVVPFSIAAQGVKLPVLWGMDTAWNNTQNMRKGINHIGAGNLGIARCSFTMKYALAGDTALTSDQISMLRERFANIDRISSSLDLVLNSDHDHGIATYYAENGVCNTENWARMIVAHVKWIHKNTKHRVVAISPFNEPDYGWGQGSIDDFRAVAKLLRENYEETADIPISAGNTLNNDMATYWYDYMKPYVQWGNTHQLAGSFDTYADFFTHVADDGNYGTADELHNVGEAIVGVEYGMKAGIWWGFDAQARGAFCQMSNNGVRLGYGENRPAWTSAAVYRNDSTSEVAAFLGSSERQAATSTFLFVSKDRDVYYDGYGPTREILFEVPGGTGYQTGQANMEQMIQVECGEDVPVKVINGTYKIMNVFSKKVITQNSSLASSGTSSDVSQRTDDKKKTQQWIVSPVGSRSGGDCSYYSIRSVDSNAYLDVLNFSMDNGASVIAYKGSVGSNEQWMLKYAGDGCYRIVNKESNLCLSLEALSTGTAYIKQVKQSESKAQLWRFLPVDAFAETDAPAKPAGLTCTPLSASVKLSWNANEEGDLDGYMILRADKETGRWNTIARRVSGTEFLDNNCPTGHTYLYKIKAIDMSDNMSEASDETEVTLGDAKALAGRWEFDGSLNDTTENAFNAVSPVTPEYNTTRTLKKSGTSSISFDGNFFMQLPYQAANMKEMTISMWVNWNSGGADNQHIFDFGSGDSYFYLTPSNGSKMQLVISDGSEEQTLEVTKLRTSLWRYLTITIGSQGAAIYTNGSLTGENTAVTLRPCDIYPVLNYIGKSQDPDAPKFDGRMDDLRIYNYQMTADEVKTLYTEAKSGIENIEADDTEEKTYYNLQGMKLDDASRGVVIEKSSDGTAKKIRVQ